MGAKREHAELSYPHDGILEPLDWLRFVELRPFTRRRKELNLTDDDVRFIQIAIMLNPKGAPVVPGGAGLRKLRCARPGRAGGKRGGLRVCYVHFEDSGVVALVTAYAKGECDDLSKSDLHAIRKMIADIEREFQGGPAMPRKE